MQNQNRKTIVTLLSVQVIIAILYAFALIEVIIDKAHYMGQRGIGETLIAYLPLMVLFICSIWPQASLLFKHKLHSQDGEIMPPFFTLLSFQASIIVTDAMSALGYIFVYPEPLLIIQRFSILATASLFLLSALRYYGFSSSNMGTYTLIFIGISLLVSALVPFSNYHGEMSLMTPGYEVYTQLLVAALYLVGMITFILTAIKDNTSLTVKRSIAFIMMGLSIYLSYFNTLYAVISSILLALPATVILVLNAGDTL